MIEELNIPRGAPAHLHPCVQQLWGGPGMKSMFRHRCSRRGRFHCTNCQRQYCRTHLLKSCPHSGAVMTDPELRRHVARTIPGSHDNPSAAALLRRKGCTPDQIQRILDTRTAPENRPDRRKPEGD